MPAINESSPISTNYNGPIVITEHRVAGQVIRLARPEAPDRLLEQAEVIDWNRRDDYMPYWAYLWPGSLLLAEVVAKEPIPVNVHSDSSAPPRVLEIGCGLGLAGLAALGRGYRVVFSDYDEAPFPFIARGIEENSFNPDLAEMRRIDWRFPPPDRFSLVLGADILYEKRLVPLVADFLAQVLEPEGVAWLTSPFRVSADGFPTSATERGLRCETESIVGLDENGRDERGTLFRVYHA